MLFRSLGVLILLAGTPLFRPALEAQTRRSSPTIYGLGSGFLVTRLDERKLWGLNARAERYIRNSVVYRGYASVEFLSPGTDFAPVLAGVGADVGLRGHGALIGTVVAVGASVLYFGGDRNRAYDSGLLLAGTGSFGLEARIRPGLGLFGEVRMYVPSRIGAAGYASDPHAAFVRVTFGLTLGR